MGFDSRLFVEPVHEDYLCNICSDVLKKPLQCANGHCFCSTCIHEWVASNKKDDLLCPQCEPATEAKNMSKKKKAAHFCHNTALASVLQRLKVGCPTILEAKDDTDGVDGLCRWQGQLQERLAHIAICSYAKTTCPSQHCHDMVCRMNMPVHLAQCPHRVTKCGHCDDDVVVNDMIPHLLTCHLAPVKCGCGITFARHSLPLHQESCPDCDMFCTFASFGCSMIAPRRDMPEHEREHAAQHASLLITAREQQSFVMAVQGFTKQVALVKKDVAFIRNHMEKVHRTPKPVVTTLSKRTGASKTGGTLKQSSTKRDAIAIEENKEEKEEMPRRTSGRKRSRPRAASLLAKEKVMISKGGKRVSVRYFVDPNKPAKVKQWTIGTQRTRAKAMAAAQEFLDDLHSKKTGDRWGIITTTTPSSPSSPSLSSINDSLSSTSFDFSF